MKKYSYQINNSEIYSSKIKAHRRLCNLLGVNEDEYLPIKEKVSDKCIGWIETHYPNGSIITKRIIL